MPSTFSLPSSVCEACECIIVVDGAKIDDSCLVAPLVLLLELPPRAAADMMKRPLAYNGSTFNPDVNSMYVIMKGLLNAPM